MLSNALYIEMKPPVSPDTGSWIGALLHQCTVTAMQLSNAILQYYNVLRSTMKPDVYPAPGLGLYDINAMSSNRKCYQMHRTVLQ